MVCGCVANQNVRYLIGTHTDMVPTTIASLLVDWPFGIPMAYC